MLRPDRQPGSRARRVLTSVLVLVVLQGALVALYLLHAADGATPPGGAAVERLARPAPDLVFRASDGRQRRLSALRGRPVVLHFWATWCPPCREELPAVLALADADVGAVLAVSLDPDPAAVRRFFGHGPPAAVAQASAAAAARDFGVATLPVTFLIDAAGTLRLRFQGPQDWSSGALRALLRDAGGAS